MNREYSIALQYVRTQHRALYAYAEAIVLTPASYFPAAQEGQCSHDNFISIRDGLATTGAYVNVLVQELTHARQNATGSLLNSLQREEEAYQAGIAAEREYMLKAAPWARPCNRVVT